jgi:hypothetical protein
MLITEPDVKSKVLDCLSGNLGRYVNCRGGSRGCTIVNWKVKEIFDINLYSTTYQSPRLYLVPGRVGLMTINTIHNSIKLVEIEG